MPREKQNFWRPDKEYKGRRGIRLDCGEDSAVSVLLFPGMRKESVCRDIRLRVLSSDDKGAYQRRRLLCGRNGRQWEMIQNFLCRLTGGRRKGLRISIFKKAAVEHTRKRLEEAGLSERAKVILHGFIPVHSSPYAHAHPEIPLLARSESPASSRRFLVCSTAAF